MALVAHSPGRLPLDYPPAGDAALPSADRPGVSPGGDDAGHYPDYAARGDPDRVRRGNHLEGPNLSIRRPTRGVYAGRAVGSRVGESAGAHRSIAAPIMGNRSATGNHRGAAAPGMDNRAAGIRGQKGRHEPMDHCGGYGGRSRLSGIPATERVVLDLADVALRAGYRALRAPVFLAGCRDDGFGPVGGILVHRRTDARAQPDSYGLVCAAHACCREPLLLPGHHPLAPAGPIFVVFASPNYGLAATRLGVWRVLYSVPCQASFREHETMATRNHATAQSQRIADRLVAARRGRFVGRSDELDLFCSAIQGAEPPFAVLYVYGPGGIGKTTLLQEYARRAAMGEKIVVQVDGRNIDPTPTGFLFALSQCLELEDVSLAHVIANWPSTGLLLIDRYEILTALDGWLRETFLPQLPAQSLVVIASRNAPTSPWRTDIDWAELTRIAPLRDLRPDECQTYLTTRGIPDDLHTDILAFTHGHPLALALVADVLGRGGKLPSRTSLYEPEPDVVRVLLERLVQDVPDAAHRLALDICVRMWATTETLLGDMLDGASDNDSDSDAHTLFEWLRQLPFIEEGPFGLFPHDLAREVLDADWRWRNPESFRRSPIASLRPSTPDSSSAHGMEQQRIWFYLLYLCRHSPIYRPYYEWSALGSAYAEVASTHDHPTILALIARYQGEASAKIAAYWLERQPQAFRIFRNVGGDVFGFMTHLLLRQPSPEDVATDPAIQSAVDFIARHGPLRQDEEILYARFWMTARVSRASRQPLISRRSIQLLT